MNQYGANDMTSNQQYQGQAPMGMGTGTGNAPADPLEKIRNPAAYGFRRDEPGGFQYPGAAGVGAQGTSHVEPNVRHPSQAGYGVPQSGFNPSQNVAPGDVQSRGILRDDFAKDQPTYGQPGFGQRTQGQNTTNLWPTPASPPNAHHSDLVGQGHGASHAGMVNRAQDTTGMDPSSGYGSHPGYDKYGNMQQQGTDTGSTPGAMGGYGNPNAPNTGMGGYNNPTDMQPGRGGYNDPTNIQPGRGGGYDNPNYNHPTSGTGFGGGAGPQTTQSGYGGSQDPSSGYNKQFATGADAYTQPRREGMDDPMRGDAGVGRHPGYDDGTRTGTNPYVPGKHTTGMHDSGTGLNDPSSLQTGDVNQRVPQSMLGERRTEPGYGTGHHTTTGTGLGNQGTGYDEGRAKGYEDPAGAYGSKTGTGAGTGTYGGTGTDEYGATKTGTATGADDYGTSEIGTGSATDEYGATKTSTGTDTYDGSGTGTGYDDMDTHGAGSGAPKKGLMTKIKEKLHH